jgi:hypothetical protein
MPQDPPPIPPSLPATPIEYARPMPREWHAPIFSPRIALHVWAMGFAVFVVLIFGIPKFEQVFKDFKTELPLVTKITLLIDRWFCNDYGWLMMLPLAIAAPLGVSALIGIGNPTPDEFRRREIWASRGVRLLMLLLVLWLGVSLFAPMAALINSISGSAPKK